MDDDLSKIFQIPKQEKPLFTRKRKFVLRKLEGEELFSGKEITVRDAQEGFKTTEEQAVYQAGCGHFVGFQNPAELMATCAGCTKTLCWQCGNLRCRRCLQICCDTCAKVVDEAAVYCNWCRAIVFAKRGLIGLHNLLSKEWE